MAPSEFDNKDNVCEWVMDIIEPLLDRELSAEETSRMRAHLDRCAACSGELELAEATRAAIRKLPAQQCPASVTDAVMLHISHEASTGEPAPGWWKNLLTWKPLRPAAVAAALVLIVSISVFIGHKGENPAPDIASDTLKIGPEEVALAEAEVKWALAYVSKAGRRAGFTVRDKALYPHVVAPAKHAMGNVIDGNNTNQP